MDTAAAAAAAGASSSSSPGGGGGVAEEYYEWDKLDNHRTDVSTDNEKQIPGWSLMVVSLIKEWRLRGN